MDTKLLSAPESNNTLARCSSLGVVVGGLSALTCIMSSFSTGMTNYQYWLLIASSGWSFVSAIPGQMTHLVASITLDSARSCVMQSAFLTQRMVSNVPIVFSWGGRIRLEGFLSSVLLWLVIIVVVVGVGVTVVVIVVVVVVESYSVVKLSFVIT
ncbi:hypothetical protein Tco_0874066 [Tanacetum coccineum]|uniref:Uncharacterized protein n=1 Tax=Tanacetum coccineum TaxID=301880 RepID=A0ABQ5BKK9_9ASTR